jgi:hypothetical protein
MNQTKIKMYVNTCDATMFFIPIFSYFYEKYWTVDADVEVLGFSKPDFELPDRFNYVSLNDKQIGGVNSWSNYLVDYFENIPDEIILWGIDDHIIVDDIDVELYDFLVKKIQTDKTIGRISLIGNIEQRKYDVIESYADFDLIQQRSGTSYLIDCQFSLWRKEYLLKYLMKNWTPWQFEIDGSKLAAYSDFKVLGTTNRHCVQKIEGKRHFADRDINLLGAKYRDIIDVVNKGIIKKENIVGKIDWIWIGKE